MKGYYRTDNLSVTVWGPGDEPPVVVLRWRYTSLAPGHDQEHWSLSAACWIGDLSKLPYFNDIFAELEKWIGVTGAEGDAPRLRRLLDGLGYQLAQEHRPL